MSNFKFPYFSRNIGEFWRKWHISLSTWFRDYLYIPLGGNRVKRVVHFRNLLLTFIVSGVWHGANWTFVLWGTLHGLYLIIELILRRNVKRDISWLILFPNIFLTFIMVMIGWVFFRADNVVVAIEVVSKIFLKHGAPFLDKTELAYGIFCLVVLILKEFKDEFNYNLSILSSRKLVVNICASAIMIYLIVILGVTDSDQFIYFQF